MTWKQTILGAVAGLLVLSACGQAPAQEDAASGPSESASEQFKKRPAEHEAKNGPVPKSQLNAGGLPDAFPREAKARDSKLTITAQEGGCSEASAEVSDQAADTVTVLLVETEPADKMMCTMDVRYPPVTVELDQPLGDRTLVLEHTKRKE